MIVEKCFFDPVKDIAPVEQFGFVDLKSALANSVVPSVVADAESDYNGIENPDSILGKPTDVFEAMDMQSALLESAKSDESKDA